MYRLLKKRNMNSKYCSYNDLFNFHDLQELFSEHRDDVPGMDNVGVVRMLSTHAEANHVVPA